MLTEPLKRTEAKKLISWIIKNGDISYAQPHALERMRERKIDNLDCVNILRAGVVNDPEFENGTWRYRIHTAKMAVIIRFVDETELMIITALREKT